MTTDERVKRAEESTNTSPTEGQKRSGNYKKGKITIQGFKISIENPRGSVRTGVDKDGRQWKSKMKFTYGYFRNTIGKDGDPIDVYIGHNLGKVEQVFIIDQVEEKSRAFDEHKVMFGFESAQKAKEAYLSCYEDGWKGFQNITAVGIKKFRKWIGNKDAIKYPASRLNMSSKTDFKSIKNFAADDSMCIIKMMCVVEDGITLADLQKQAGDLANITSLVVEIGSPGGSVAEGLQIMMWLDQISQSGIQVTTVVSANAYSIASLIMLAADLRMISTHGKVMVHNPMVPELQYANANELEKYVQELRELEMLMYELYQIYTGLDTEQIKALMDKETFLTPDEAVQFGFADMVVEIEKKPYIEAVNVKNIMNMSKMVNTLRKIIAKVNGSDLVNQLYYTDEGGEIEIFQSDPSTYQIGDAASIPEGEVKLADGAKLKIEEGVITEIDKEIDEAEIEDETSEEEVAAVEGDEATEEVVEEEIAEFNEGPAPDEVAVEGDDELASPGASPVVPQSMDEEEVAEEKPTEEIAEEVIEAAEGDEIPVEAPIEMPAEEPIIPAPTDTQGSELVKKYSKLEQKIADLEKEKMDILEKFNAMAIRMEKLESKSEKIEQFETVATEAIESIAKNTGSGFNPEARSVAKVDVNVGKSIFQRIKSERGLK